MRLYRLSLSGVGPFAGSCEIDFSRLGDAGLFLLEGPTGAGKSSILDALSFALYGKVAQASGDAERLRSHFAGPDDESSVVLVFETQAGSYRIRRTPKYQRPKRRGAGFTSVNATAALWRLSTVDGDPLTAPGELLSNRLDEVADEVTRAVGLTHAQFVQTVILPQGEFAGFLRASSDEKRGLLQRLFGTEVLARVQASLVEQRQQAERSRARSDQTLAHAVQAFAGAAGLDFADSEPSDDVPDLAGVIEAALAGAQTGPLTELTTTTLRRLAARVAGAQQRADDAQATRRCTLESLRRAQELETLRTRRAELRARLRALQDAEPAAHKKREELAAAERAAPIRQLAQACQDSAARSLDAGTRAAALRARLGAPWRSADELAIRLQVSHLRETLGSLREHVEAESTLRSRIADLARLRAEQDVGSILLEQLQTQLDAGSVLSATLAIEGETLAVQAAGIASYELALSRAEAVVRAATAADAAAEKARVAQRTAHRALLAEQLSAEHLHHLRTRRLAGIAGELGMALVPGQPCQVCGCRQHPAPAQPGSDQVSLPDLQQAEQDLVTRTSARERTAVALAEVEREHARQLVLASGLGGAAAVQQHQHAAADLAVARTGQDRLAGVIAERTELTEQLGRLQARREQAGAGVEVRAERIRRAGLDIAELEQSLIGARADFPTVADRVVDIDGQLLTCEDAASAINEETAAVAAAAEDQQRFTKMLAEAGFADEADFDDALRNAQTMTRLRAELADRHADWLNVTDSLTDPALQALDQPAHSSTPPDVAQLQRVVGDAERDAAQAAGQLGGLSAKLADATARADHIDVIIGTRAEVLATTAPAIRLGNLVSGLGDNQLRMDLATYVLVRRFADIVAAANDQLSQISNGRYLLEHSDAKQGNSRSGLGLLVRDLTTDRTRDPATLSGGETFYVSLALALGLADVVRSESGGVDLGTLFIDEGFGTLDSDVLDEVLRVLEGLRAGGRAVGVVSHVAELKARISDRIEVRRNPDGSSRLAVVC